MVLYREFKTVMEMVYVLNKAYINNVNQTDEQKSRFEQNFAANLLHMLQNKKFQKEYALYEEALAQGKIIFPPKTWHQVRLNAILREVYRIEQACQEHTKQPSAICKKYEKRLNNNISHKFLVTMKKEK